ncbi:MAG TPA: Rieske 2Fe-2S domain-containing protein [Pirellulales bacterium]|nr:Rieske 2Fe-2S domain-containing protein [Pirellulales bacterium]
MDHWIAIAAAKDCPPGTAIERIAGSRVVALFNVDGMFYALDGVCPHQGGPLGKGRLSGATVTCPWHGWQFDVSSGQHQLSKSCVQESFPVRVEQDQVWVNLGGGPPQG